MRRLAFALCLVCTTFAVFGAGTAAADPVNNPNALVFTVACDGLGTFTVVGTGSAGHVLGSKSIGVLLAGTTTVFVNGVQVDQETFDHPGQGVSTVSCSAFAEFTDGPNTVRIEITDARVHVTPATG